MVRRPASVRRRSEMSRDNSSREEATPWLPRSDAPTAWPPRQSARTIFSRTMFSVETIRAARAFASAPSASVSARSRAHFRLVARPESVLLRFLLRCPSGSARTRSLPGPGSKRPASLLSAMLSAESARPRDGVSQRRRQPRPPRQGLRAVGLARSIEKIKNLSLVHHDRRGEGTPREDQPDPQSDRGRRSRRGL